MQVLCAKRVLLPTSACRACAVNNFVTEFRDCFKACACFVLCLRKFVGLGWLMLGKGGRESALGCFYVSSKVYTYVCACERERDVFLNERKGWVGL